MDSIQLVQELVQQLTDEGFIKDEEEKSYTLIDYRGTHKVVTYWIEGLWVTFTQTIENDDGLQTTLFDDLITSEA
jgi:hypothetical protein